MGCTGKCTLWFHGPESSGVRVSVVEEHSAVLKKMIINVHVWTTVFLTALCTCVPRYCSRLELLAFSQGFREKRTRTPGVFGTNWEILRHSLPCEPKEIFGNMLTDCVRELRRPSACVEGENKNILCHSNRASHLKYILRQG